MGLAQRTCIPKRAPASTSVLAIKTMEEWTWVDERALVPFRGARVCMTCQHFTYGLDQNCHTLLGCKLRQGLLQHGEHLTRQCEHWASVTEVDMGGKVAA